MSDLFMIPGVGYVTYENIYKAHVSALDAYPLQDRGDLPFLPGKKIHLFFLSFCCCTGSRYRKWIVQERPLRVRQYISEGIKSKRWNKLVKPLLTKKVVVLPKLSLV